MIASPFQDASSLSSTAGGARRDRAARRRARSIDERIDRVRLHPEARAYAVGISPVQHAAPAELVLALRRDVERAREAGAVLLADQWHVE